MIRSKKLIKLIICFFVLLVGFAVCTSRASAGDTIDFKEDITNAEKRVGETIKKNVLAKVKKHRISNIQWKQVLSEYWTIEYVPVYYDYSLRETKDGSAYIKVKPILQLPELPTGCEATALDTALLFYGFDIDKVTLAHKYFLNEDNSRDFRYHFIGDPTDYIKGLGCYSKAVVDAANMYLKEQDTDLWAFDYTGYTFERLLEEVANNNPVIIWVSINMEDPFYGINIDVDGEVIRWISREHCMLLTGYDTDKGLVSVSDPQKGLTTYDINIFKERFIQLNSQAVVIKDKYDKIIEDKNTIISPGADRYMPADIKVRGCKGFDGVLEAY